MAPEAATTRHPDSDASLGDGHTCGLTALADATAGPRRTAGPRTYWLLSAFRALDGSMVDARSRPFVIALQTPEADQSRRERVDPTARVANPVPQTQRYGRRPPTGRTHAIVIDVAGPLTNHDCPGVRRHRRLELFGRDVGTARRIHVRGAAFTVG